MWSHEHGPCFGDTPSAGVGMDTVRLPLVYLVGFPEATVDSYGLPSFSSGDILQTEQCHNQDRVSILVPSCDLTQTVPICVYLGAVWSQVRLPVFSTAPHGTQ